MALIPCPECKREISDRALVCPQCGAPRTAAGAASQQIPSPGTARSLLFWSLLVVVGLVLYSLLGRT